MVKKAAPKRDPRFAWLFVVGAFALVLFACVLIVIGDKDQRAFVNAVFEMSGVMLGAGGFIQADVIGLLKK